MNVAIVGNVAQNGWLLTRFLRQWTDVEAHLYYDAAGPPLWHPYWEDALVSQRSLRAWQSTPTGATGVIELESPWRQPAWAHPIFWPASRTAPVCSDRLPASEHADVARGAGVIGAWEFMRTIADRHDLIVLLGPYAAYGVVFPKDRPYVTFEHSTMRDVVAKQDELLRLAYTHADWNVLTNADCGRVAEQLGLTRYSWLPHPVDTQRFSPASDHGWRRSLLKQFSHVQPELLFLAPARQTAPRDGATKANPVLFRAFARYVHQLEPAGAPRAALFALDYGEAAGEHRALVDELGIADRVVWFDLLPKRELLRYYRACDVVLDQFGTEIGSYGTCAVEALACARPVITYIDVAKHRWCEDVAPVPPVCNVSTEEAIADELGLLALKPHLRRALGEAGRAWVERYHSAERVTRRHAQLYSSALANAGRADQARWRWTGDATAGLEPALMHGRHPLVGDSIKLPHFDRNAVADLPGARVRELAGVGVGA